MQEEKPQAKRARIATSQQSVPAANGSAGVQCFVPSSTTGATMAPQPPAMASSQHPVKPSDALAPANSSKGFSSDPVARVTALPETSAAPAPRAPGPAPAPAVSKKPANFLADAREAVLFRAVAAPSADALAAEIASGGAPVSVDFLHQHFGDSEQIRGYSGLRITLWIHVRTYHTWVDIIYSAKRPGADKLGDIVEGAFPSGYCRSQEEFVAAVTSTLATLPNLGTLGDCVGKVPIAATAYGVRTSYGTPAAAAIFPAAATASASVPVEPTGAAGGAPRGDDAMQVDGGGSERRTGEAAAAGQVVAAAAAEGPRSSSSGGAVSGGKEVVEVSVRRFQLTSAPPEVKALHARLEPLLLFTIDGANFIDDEDPQWELLLPVVQAEDGGSIVLGLTTLFNFFAYPASCRLRVSQVLVLSPWQGLGLGKALLRLSYDLARARGCADLTVEDPTPNLQRVREKLEVEMLRRLKWVAAQAEKCLAAASRGETTWPDWRPPQQLETKPPGTAMGPETAGTSTATPARDSTAAAGTSASSAGAAAAVTAQGAAQAPQPEHPLLASHGFFAALCAVPPEVRELPAAVHNEATSAAEARWREKLAAAEAAAAATAADAAAPESKEEGGSSAGGSGTNLEVGSGATAGTAAAGAAGGSGGGGGDVSDVLMPSAAFVSAISQELKMHKGQIRVVWEALLWCQPGGLKRPGVRKALERMLERRLEAQHFSSVGRAAAAKRLVDTARTTTTKAAGADKDDNEDSDVSDFFMYRPVVHKSGSVPARQLAEAAADGSDVGTAGGGEGAAAGQSAVDASAVATGRLNLTQVTADDKARRMAELMQERLQQLESLAAVLNTGVQ